jgi:Aspartyl protease
MLASLTIIAWHLVSAQGLPAPEHLSLSGPKIVVPMTFVGGRPVVEAKLNGKGPYRFIFDTGAAGIVISNELAAELNLPALQHAAMGSPESKTPLPATVTRLEKLEIGGAKAEGVSAVYSDLSLLSKLSKDVDAPRGVISSIGFPGWIVSIDFVHAQLVIEPGELPAADGSTFFEWRRDERIPTVPLKMLDLEMRAHIDSGSGAGITLAPENANKLPLTDKQLSPEKVRFVDSDFPVTTAKLNGPISIGAIKLTDPPIRYHEGSYAANIGQAVLREFTLRIDAKNRRIQFVQ